MTRLFSRKCVVIVDTLRVENLRVAFKVHKDTGSKPNTCEVSITNLSAATRRQIQTKGAPLILQAGYPGSIATIFSGVTRTVDHVRAGPDWETRIRSGDGERAYGFAAISNSYRAGTSTRAVLTDLVNSLGLDTGTTAQVFAGLTGQFVNGYTAHGKSARLLDEVLGGLGYEWSVQDGRVQVLPKGGSTTEEAVVLSPDTGLLDSPEHGSGDGKAPAQHSSMVKLRSLLQGRIKPGGRVVVQSEGLSGTLRVLTVEHRGDTAGADWLTELEAVPA